MNVMGFRDRIIAKDLISDNLCEFNRRFCDFFSHKDDRDLEVFISEGKFCNFAEKTA